MSQIGNEAISSTMGIAEKTTEGALKAVGGLTKGIVNFLKFLLNHQERKAQKIQNQLSKMKIKDLKNAEYRKKMVDYLNTKKGIVKLKKILDSQEKYTVLAQSMSKKDAARFNQLAKTYGISFAVIEDKEVKEHLKDLKKEMKTLQTVKEPTVEQQKRLEELSKEINTLENNPSNFFLVVRDKDLEIVKLITDKMNLEKRTEAIDKEIDELDEQLNSESLTQDEKDEIEAKIDDLKKEKENLNTEYTNILNDNAYENISNGRIKKGNFELVANDLATSEIGSSKIVCNAVNPKNYMVVSTENVIYQDRQCKETTFDVYKNDVKQKCDYYSKQHGLFKYRTDNKGTYTSEAGLKNWDNIKKEMAEKMELIDNKDVLVFDNQADYEKYRNSFEKKLDKENSAAKKTNITYETDTNSYIDCDGMKNKIKSQVEEIKLELNNMPDIKIEQALNNKANLLNKEINCYSEIEKLQNEKRFIVSQMKMNEEIYNNEANKELYEVNQNNYNGKMAEIDEKLNDKEKELENINKDKAFLDTKIDEFKENGIKEAEYEIESSEKNPLREENNDKEYQSKEQWVKDMDNNNNHINKDFGNLKEKDIAKDKGGRE